MNEDLLFPPAKELIEFMHEFYPVRAQWLSSEIKKQRTESGTFEPWLNDLLVQLIEALITNAADLELAYADHNTSRLAWVGRNILELSVWMDYCLLSEVHAKRFRDDAMRDLAGWASAIQTGCQDTAGNEDAGLRQMQTRLAAFAASEYEIGKLDDAFTRVSAAAKEVGRHADFARENKILSKFAHPTAMVIYTALNTGALRDIRHWSLRDGVERATDSLTEVREFFMKRLSVASNHRSDQA